MNEDAKDATRLLSELGGGNRDARASLLSLLYQELHQIARHQMAHQSKGHTLQPTALVNEAWMKIVEGQAESEWENRSHFLRVAARAMRQVLVDHARKKQAQKRGDGSSAVPLDEVVVQYEERSLDLIALDEALVKLGEIDPRSAKIVELRFFAGLTIDETAEVLEVSTPTVERGWRVARLWLKREVTAEDAE